MADNEEPSASAGRARPGATQRWQWCVLLLIGGVQVCEAQVVHGAFTTDAINSPGHPFDGRVVTGLYSYDTSASATATLVGSFTQEKHYPALSLSLTINGQTVTTTDAEIWVRDSASSNFVFHDVYQVRGASFSAMIDGQTVASAAMVLDDPSNSAINGGSIVNPILPSSPPPLSAFAGPNTLSLSSTFGSITPATVTAHAATAPVPSLSEWGALGLIALLAGAFAYRQSQLKSAGHGAP